MFGQVDSTGSLMARGQYNWIPQAVPQPPSPEKPVETIEAPKVETEKSVDIISATKFQAQMPSKAAGAMAQQVLQLEHEHVGRDFTINVKATNPDPFKSSKGPGMMGVPETYSIAGLQSVSKSLALGGELAYPAGEFPVFLFPWNIVLLHRKNY